MSKVLTKDHYSLWNTHHHYNVYVKHGINMTWTSSVNLTASVMTQGNFKKNENPILFTLMPCIKYNMNES